MKDELGVAVETFPPFRHGGNRFRRLRMDFGQAIVEREKDAGLRLAGTDLRIERLGLRPGDVTQGLPLWRSDPAEILAM